MGPVDAIKICFSKYFTFSGRAPRSEYWWFFLFHMLLSLVPIVQILSLATIIPMIAVSWRRLHDAGKPGWFIFLPLMLMPFAFLPLIVGPVPDVIAIVGMLLPVVAAFYVTVQLVSRGHDAPNDFGASPLRFSPA